MQTPHRFRSKRQLWTYSGLGIETHDSAQYRFVRGQLQRAKKPQQIRGLNQNHNHEMKEIFKGAATRASLWGGAVARLLCGFAGQRHEARDGTSNASTEDRGHCFDTLEKGGTFRPRTTEDASSLSAAQNSSCSPRSSYLVGGQSVLRRSGSRESIHAGCIGRTQQDSAA